MVIIDFFKDLFDKAINITAFQCLYILLIAAGIIFIYSFIRVLIKAWQEKGLVTLLLGIFIPGFAFIWGWIKNEELDIKTIMTTWTTSIIVLVSFYAILLVTTGV